MNQKGFANIILVVVILVLILLGAVGYFVLMKKLTPVTQQTPTPTKTHVSPTPTSQTTDLKTYTNIQYGFEFQYPFKDLSVAEGYVSSGDPEKLVYVVNIFTIPHGQDRNGLVGVVNSSLEQTLQALNRPTVEKQILDYNGIYWTRISRDSVVSDYLVERNGQTFWLGVDPYPGALTKSGFETILNTFKFLK
jgi:hypothetical protein